MVGLLTSRAVSWLILGGGIFAVVAMVYMGGAMRGASKENTAWKAAIAEDLKEKREINFRVDQATIGGDRDLQREEDAIREKWRMRGIESKAGVK